MIKATLSVLLVSVLLAGCSSNQQTTDIMIVDGCMIEIKGLLSETANDIEKNWRVGDDCELNSTKTLNDNQ